MGNAPQVEVVLRILAAQDLHIKLVYELPHKEVLKVDTAAR